MIVAHHKKRGSENSVFLGAVARLTGSGAEYSPLSHYSDRKTDTVVALLLTGDKILNQAKRFSKRSFVHMVAR